MSRNNAELLNNRLDRGSSSSERKLNRKLKRL
jgi:hypothetical protein